MAVFAPSLSDGINLPGPISATANRTALTAMAWVNVQSWSTTNQKICGYSTGTNLATSRFTFLGSGGAPGFLQVAGRASDAEGGKSLNAVTALSTGIWHHVVGIIDYASSVGYIYIDGVLDAGGGLSAAFAAGMTDSTDSLNGSIATRENASGSQGLVGAIEDFRLYSAVLGPGVIASIYAARGRDGITASLLERYVLNEGAVSSAVVDCRPISSGEMIIGTPIGSPTFTDGIVAIGRRDLQAGVSLR